MTEAHAARQRLPFNTHTVLACVVLPLIWVIGAIWLTDAPIIALGHFLFGLQMLSVMGLACTAVFLSRVVPTDHPSAGFILGMIWSGGTFALLHGLWMLFWGGFSVIFTLITTGSVPVFDTGSHMTQEEYLRKMEEFFAQEGWLNRETTITIISWTVFLIWMLPLEFANAVVRRGLCFARAVQEQQGISVFHWRSLIGGALMLTAMVLSWRATMPGS